MHNCGYQFVLMFSITNSIVEAASNCQHVFMKRYEHRKCFRMFALLDFTNNDNNVCQNVAAHYE